MAQDPLAALKKISPSLNKKMKNNSLDAFGKGSIPVKYKYLLAMALDAAAGTADGVAALAGEAVEAGATQEEIAEVLEILHYICGGGSIYTASIGLDKIDNLSVSLKKVCLL